MGVTPERRNREGRTPFGGFQAKLDVTNRQPGFHYYWFLNRGDDLARAEAAGYEYVRPGDPELISYRDVHGGNQSTEGRVERYAGRDEYGRERMHVLMRQPMEYRLEDVAHKELRNAEIDNAIRRQDMPGTSVVSKYGNVKMGFKQEE